MREVQGHAKTIRELLKGNRYSIDYYQREYKWQKKQIVELIDDLVEAFLESYDPSHPRSAVRNYGRYFLGSIILSQRDGVVYIVDGQQRLTSLTLLLIYLRNLQGKREDRVNVDELIFSTQYGEKNFNLNVDERIPVLNALYEGIPFEKEPESESVENILARYKDIENHFPASQTASGEEEDDVEAEMRSVIDERALPYFVDWLIENVHLVEITAFSDEDAYTIFETMNDRGLSLSPTDMLKGYVLANITDYNQRNQTNDVWKRYMKQLDEHGAETSSDFIKAWLRSQHARSIRARKKNSQPRDFERIGTGFHRWIKENTEQLGLDSNADFVRFIQTDLDFFARQYLLILDASEHLRPGLERVHYVNRFGFTLPNMVLLAPLRPGDSDDVVRTKFQLVSHYVDMLITLRQWNYKTVSYSAMQYAMFVVIQEIRHKVDVEDLARTLHRLICAEPWTFTNDEPLALHQRNRWFVGNVLARLTDYVETESGNPSRYTNLMAERTPNRYEIEHIWSVEHADHEDEFPYRGDFLSYRNHVGGLLLLPKKFNASYGKLPYEQKLPHYNTQNMLARSLHPQAYEHNPGFRQFVERSGLPFRPHEHFRKEDLDARQRLYQEIAARIWNPDVLLETVGAQR